MSLKLIEWTTVISPQVGHLYIGWSFLRGYGHFNVLQHRKIFYGHMTVNYGRNEFYSTGPRYENSFPDLMIDTVVFLSYSY